VLGAAVVGGAVVGGAVVGGAVVGGAVVVGAVVVTGAGPVVVVGLDVVVAGIDVVVVVPGLVVVLAAVVVGADAPPSLDGTHSTAERHSRHGPKRPRAPVTTRASKQTRSCPPLGADCGSGRHSSAGSCTRSSTLPLTVTGTGGVKRAASRDGGGSKVCPDGLVRVVPVASVAES